MANFAAKAGLTPLVHALLLLVTSAGGSVASDAVRGIETTFQSWFGVTERCVRIDPIPSGKYDKGDIEDEAAYCAIDLYSSEVALCPKTWKTSPGMLIYDISSGLFEDHRLEFQGLACAIGKQVKQLAKDDLAKFKFTMNGPHTSSTFSTSSLLYYHFSRYFDMTAKVPVAVWRSMDAKVFLVEVAQGGLFWSSENCCDEMNHSAWQETVSALENPESYGLPDDYHIFDNIGVPEVFRALRKAYGTPDDLFTADRTQIYGVLLKSPGYTYGYEIHGRDYSYWGEEPSHHFQETPAFLALRSDKPLDEAIAEGLKQGRRDPQIAQDLAPDTPPQQMAYWMRELSEIVLMDFIFNQQDRAWNVDFLPYYYWLQNGKLRRKKAKNHEPGDGVVPADAILLHRTMLNDNDAGGRVEYINFTMKTQMLEKLRHFDGKIYTRLLELDADLQAQGRIYAWLRDSFGLDEAQVQQIVTNTSLAADILRASCERGVLRFDLNPKRFFETGDVTPDVLTCSGADPAP